MSGATMVRTPDAATERHRLSGLLWLTWRQNRAALLAGLAFCVVATVYIIWGHHDTATYIDRNAFPACDREPNCFSGPQPGNVEAIAHEYLYDFRDPVTYAGWGLIALPTVIGLFLGAPMIAREWESGTYKLVCAQSVSRTRWFAARLALPAALVLTGASLVSALYSRWSNSVMDYGQKLGEYAGNPYLLAWQETVPFNASGPLAVSLALLGLLVGTTAGLLLRRTMPAMGVALAATAGAQLAVTTLRGHLLPTKTVTTRVQGNSDIPRGTWWGERGGFILRDGRHVDPFDCRPALDGSPGGNSCYAKGDVIGQWSDIHPRGQFWALQWIEAGICLAVAVALAAFCLWRVGRDRRVTA